MKIRAAVAVLAAALTLAGCGFSGDADLASDDHTHIDPLDPNHMAPEQVATTAMGVILSWKPTEDASPTDAFVRAKRWLGGELLEAGYTIFGPVGRIRRSNRISSSPLSARSQAAMKVGKSPGWISADS